MSIGGKKLTGTIQLDDTKKPKWIDIKLVVNNKVITILGIYEVRDGVFRLASPELWEGKRPTALKEATDVVLATYKYQQAAAPNP